MRQNLARTKQTPTMDEDSPRVPTARRRSIYDFRANPEKVVGKVVVPTYQKSKETADTLLEGLKQNLLFQHLSNQQLTTVVNAMVKIQAEDGEKVIVQGEDGKFFFLVESGTFDVYVDDTKVKTYSKGDSFGELALLYDQPRSATVKANGRGTIWALDGSLFKQLIVLMSHERRKSILNFLRSVPILKALNDKEILTLSDVLIYRHVPDGMCIFKQNSPADGMYFITSGKVRIAVMANNTETDLKILSTGEYFGELALLNKKPRAASAYAVGTVMLEFLETETFERLLGPCMNIFKRNTALYQKQMTDALIKKVV